MTAWGLPPEGEDEAGREAARQYDRAAAAMRVRQVDRFLDGDVEGWDALCAWEERLLRAAASELREVPMAL
jgi:hypothetical protein